LSLLQTQALVGSKYESGSLMEVCSPTSESLGCDSSANGPSVLPCHVCCSRVGSSHGSVKRDRVRCPHAWSVRSYGELAVAFVPTGTCVTWQGFSRVIRCYAYGDRCSWLAWTAAVLRASRLGWDSSRGCAVRLWCAAAPHVVACITACTRTRSSRSRRLQPLPLMVAARCTDTSVLERDMEATDRPPGE
jgi:hypothetical protein